MADSNYEGANLGNDQRNQKFMRLMGGGKKKSAPSFVQSGESLQPTVGPTVSTTDANREQDAKVTPSKPGDPFRNDWESVDLGDDQRKNKFMKLMGARKGQDQTPPDTKKPHGIRTGEQEEELQKKLEDHYQQSLAFKLSGAARARKGFGFHPEPEQKPESKGEGGEERQDSDRDRYDDGRSRDNDRRDQDYGIRDRRDRERDDRRDYDRRDQRDYDRRDRDYDRRHQDRDSYRGRDHDRGHNRDRLEGNSHYRDRSHDRSRHQRQEDYQSGYQQQAGAPPMPPADFSQPPPGFPAHGAYGATQQYPAPPPVNYAAYPQQAGYAAPGYPPPGFPSQFSQPPPPPPGVGGGMYAAGVPPPPPPTSTQQSGARPPMMSFVKSSNS